jgi:hypothetical protein
MKPIIPSEALQATITRAQLYQQALYHAEQAGILDEDVLAKAEYCAAYYWATDNLHFALEWFAKAESMAVQFYDEQHPRVTDLRVKKHAIEEEIGNALPHPALAPPTSGRGIER